jgi:hypothetical protein
MMKSKWVPRMFLLSGGVVIGVILSVLISYQYQKTFTKTAYEIVTLGFRTWEGTETADAYKNGQREVAHYALLHNAKVLEFFYSNSDKDGCPEATAQDLAFTYIRLGKVAQQESKQEAEEYFNKGFNIYKKFKESIGKDASREQLFSLVDKLDAAYKPQGLALGDAILGKVSGGVTK